MAGPVNALINICLTTKSTKENHKEHEGKPKAFREPQSTKENHKEHEGFNVNVSLGTKKRYSRRFWIVVSGSIHF